MLRKPDIILSILSGVLITLGFPIFNLYALTWVSLVPLLIALRGKSIRRSFYLGTLAGLVYYLCTIYWVYHSMYVYGHLPLYVSILILFLLCLYLAVYVGLFSMIFSYLSDNSRVPSGLLAPVIWVTLEYIRTYALTGYPWAVLGYTQYKFLPMIQIADITGVYGISFLIVAVNGAVFDLTALRAGTQNIMPRVSGRPLIIVNVVLAMVIGMSLIYGVNKLDNGGSNRKVKISIVQGNIPQDKKWDYKFQREVIDTYKKMTMKISSDNPDLVIWPETAVPFIFNKDVLLTREITSFQKDLGINLLFGAITAKDNSRLANSAILLSHDQNAFSIYDKMHLVPYGEYVPLRRFLPFIDKLTTVSGDFATGKDFVVMETPYAKIGNLICYEIIFPGQVRQFANRGADLLVTITNDAWFGPTSAPYQHFSIAVFRAIENRVPVARAANTGISGFIDSSGRIVNKSGIFVGATLTEDVLVGSKKSFYTKYGDVFAYLCIISVILLAARRLSIPCPF